MDETPEQILARLERHAESIRRARPPAPGPSGVHPGVQPAARRPAPGAGIPTSSSGLPSRSLLRGVQATPRPAGALAPQPAPSSAPAPPTTLVVHWDWGGERTGDLIPDETYGLPRFGLMLRTVAGQALAVICCMLALLASIYLSVSTALVVVGIVTVACGIGAIRKVPLAGWCTLGLVIGLALGRFS